MSRMAVQETHTSSYTMYKHTCTCVHALSIATCMYIYVHVHAQHRLVMQEVQYMCMPYIVPLGNGLIKVSDGIVWVCACIYVCLVLEDTLDALIGLRTDKMGGRKERKREGRRQERVENKKVQSLSS